MNPLSLLKSLGSSQISFLDPLLQTSFALGTEMRKAGILPNKGYTPAYGGPTVTGREKMAKAWTSEGMVYTDESGGGGFGFRTGNGKPYSQPSYKDAQGNIYDAVSGRLLYLAKSKPNTATSPTVAPPFPGGSPAAERAEKQERSRVAQITQQDPLFKKYRVAELTKAYNTASPEDKEKIGLEIWATTNPQLAQKLKPGQLGYTRATSAVMSQSPLGQFQAQTGDMQYANKMDQVPGAMAGFQPQTPLTGIQVPATPQFGASEVFAKSTPIPGATEMFTDPRKFLSQEELSQTQLALLKKALESRIK